LRIADLAGGDAVRRIGFGLLIVAALVGSLRLPFGPPVASHAQAAPAGSAYVAYFWRAKPGQLDAYSTYIKTVAEPIDADAQRAAAFLEVHTVTPAQGTTTDWTHLRIFHVKDLAAAQALGAALDAATARVVSDEATRTANSARAAGLRDFVRQEIWTELR
jgi:hypothetical protein